MQKKKKKDRKKENKKIAIINREKERSQIAVQKLRGPK